MEVFQSSSFQPVLLSFSIAGGRHPDHIPDCRPSPDQIRFDLTGMSGTDGFPGGFLRPDSLNPNWLQGELSLARIAHFQDPQQGARLR
jgi:hypothetical protein